MTGNSVVTARRMLRRSQTLTYNYARVLLAVASFDGNIRFLNCAWEAVLGLDAKARDTRPLREILSPDPEVAEIIAAALLDRRCHMPIEIGLRDVHGKTCRFLWHRRYDPSDQLMYLAGEEVPAQAFEAANRDSAAGGGAVA